MASTHPSSAASVSASHAFTSLAGRWNGSMCGVGPKNTVLERVWYLKISASVPADASAPGLI